MLGVGIASIVNTNHFVFGFEKLQNGMTAYVAAMSSVKNK